MLRSRFKIGQPLPAGLLDQSNLGFSPFVLYINVVAPQEDKTQSVDAVMADMYARHSIIYRASAEGLMFLSRDENFDLCANSVQNCFYLQEGTI